MNGSLPMRVFGGLVAALIVVAGLVFTASLLVGVLVLGAVALVAAALRGGEKPRFGFHWGRGPTGPSTVVIDIEAREVEDAPPAAIDHRPKKQRSEP
jgi:hypothetical protein